VTPLFQRRVLLLIIRPPNLIFMLVFLFCLTSGSVAVAVPATTSPAGENKHSLADRVERHLARLTLEEKIGQLFIIAPDGDWEDQLRTFRPGGVILFSQHTPTIAATMKILERVRFLSPLPPLLAVDQEGGRVSRLPFATTIPTARKLSALSAPAAKNLGILVGRELRALGFNLNFAPVLDVDTRVENPVIGDRSFSADPYEVARLGSAYIQGLHVSGIASSAKHFPGHGDTTADSHLVLPRVELSDERLETVELLPFRAAILAKTDSIMVAHVSYPSWDSRQNTPASLSRPIITGILRNELGYTGLIITDAMNMKAVSSSFPPGLAAKAAFQAGVDIILMPENFPAAYLALLHAVRSGEIPDSRLDESVRRILTLKLQLPDDRNIPYPDRLRKAENIVGSAVHRQWLAQILNDAPPQTILQQE
jgi:beta-N-acetylhexosaminidase